MNTYTTIQGDMWDSIAYKLYGSCSFMDALINANGQYSGIFVFSAGVQLEVPAIESRIAATPLPPWKVVKG